MICNRKNLLVTLFLNDLLELICMHSVKWFQVFLSNKIVLFIKYSNLKQTIYSHLLKIVDEFTYLESSVSSTETDINMRLAKAWTAINRLSVIWKSHWTDKMKRSFFQAAVVLILLYGCTTWTLTKRRFEKA